MPRPWSSRRRGTGATRAPGGTWSRIWTLASLVAERDRAAAGWQAHRVGHVASHAPEAPTIPASCWATTPLQLTDDAR